MTQLYDSSKNTILVAGIPLVGVVSSSINAENILKQEQVLMLITLSTMRQ